MQHGGLATKTRLEGPDVWEFRWWEKGPNGKRVHRKRILGSVDTYPDTNAARAADLLPKIRTEPSMKSSLERADLCRRAGTRRRR